MDPESLARALSALAELPADDPVRLRVERVAEVLVKDGRKKRQRALREARAAEDAAVLAAAATGAVDRREDAALVTPSPEDADESVGTVHRPRRCYVCKALYTDVSAFYHQLCPECAAENLAWRSARTPLDGRFAVVTGGRVKIGFQVALMLLRDGASVRITTRFPHDAVRRFREVEDSAKWLDRLTVTGIDLRDPRQIVELCDALVAEGTPVDIIVNNAAQTVRRPAASYAVLIGAERDAAAGLGAGTVAEIAPITGFRAPTVESVAPVLTGGLGPAAGPALAGAAGSAGGPASPAGAAEVAVDEAGLLPDRSARNSWSAELGELDPVEVLEVQLVNTVAPTLLVDRLLPLMAASRFPRRYVVNVTAVEGRFEVRNKTAGHPHTNMAKAALNMLTRTSAEELARRGIYLSSVDTGWITDEKPMPRKERHAAKGFRTPLDIVDGAARIYQPIVSGERGTPLHGVFLKDYKAVAW